MDLKKKRYIVAINSFPSCYSKHYTFVSLLTRRVTMLSVQIPKFLLIPFKKKKKKNTTEIEEFEKYQSLQVNLQPFKNLNISILQYIFCFLGRPQRQFAAPKNGSVD